MQPNDPAFAFIPSVLQAASKNVNRESQNRNYTSFASAFRTMPSGSTLRDEGSYRTENAVAAMRSDSTTAPNVPPSDHAYTS